jgi:hypothetical protein
MSLSIQDRYLIDRYLQGEISGIELESFNNRLRNDESFRHEAELQKVIYKGIQKANHDKLKKLIISSINYRRPSIPFALKMIVTFLLVTGLGITFWFYVGTESANKEQSKSWFAFLKSKKNEATDFKDAPKVKPEFHQKPRAATDSIIISNAANIIPDSGTSAHTSADEQKDSAAFAHEEDIVVKQDQLLITTTLAVENKSGDKNGIKDETLTNEAVEKLNPGADLPEEEKLPGNYLVEFWVSPINYRGYKMSKNKLILFGIEEPDAVKLYRVNDGIYMSYLREYYRLNNSFDFVSYQKLKESEVPLAIR